MMVWYINDFVKELLKTMKIFLIYLQELGKETFFLILFLLGIGSTLSTYIPLFQDYTILKWFSKLCIFVGFIGANFRLYLRFSRKFSSYNLQNLLNELEYNYEKLQDIKYSTAPALCEEVWKLTFDKILNIPNVLRTQINIAYMNIRSAKEIHRSIQSINRFNTYPEQIEIEKLLREVKKILPDIIKDLKRYLQDHRKMSDHKS